MPKVYPVNILIWMLLWFSLESARIPRKTASSSSLTAVGGNAALQVSAPAEPVFYEDNKNRAVFDKIAENCPDEKKSQNFLIFIGNKFEKYQKCVSTVCILYSGTCCFMKKNPFFGHFSNKA